MTELKIALVSSGRGVMLQHLLDACESGIAPGRVVAVASNKECKALDVARAAGIHNVIKWERADFTTRDERDRALGVDLKEAGADFVLVAGYTQPLGQPFLDLFVDRVISPYPASLPAFGNLEEAIGPALAYGVRMLGMTIHFHAADSLSDGPIIAQSAIQVAADDTVDSVAPRLTELELTMLWNVLHAFAEDRVQLMGNQVVMT